MSNNNTNKQSIENNENDILNEYDLYMNTGTDGLAQFPTLHDDISLNYDLKGRPRNDSVNTVKSDSDTYCRVRDNSNRGEKLRNKDIFINPKSKSRENSVSSHTNFNYNMQHIRSNSGTDELTRGLETNIRTRRNNSENETMYRRKLETNDNKIGRNNSSKSEATQKEGIDINDTRVMRINSNASGSTMSSGTLDNRAENSVNEGKTMRNDMVMDIGIPHEISHKKSKSSGGDDRNNSNMKIQRSKSNVNMRKASSPIRPSQGFSHFRSEYTQDSRKKSNSNNNIDRITMDKRKDGLLYDIATNISNESEPPSNYVTPLSYQPELPFNAMKIDSPKNIINISDSNSLTKNDITFPLPPSTSLSNFDNSHIRSSSYSSGDKIQENSTLSNTLKNKIRANSLKSHIPDNNVNKPIGIPKSYSNSSLNNTDNARGIEPQSLNDEINGDIEYKTNYNDPPNTLSNTALLNNEIMKLKTKHRNTIIIPSDYIIDNKSSPLSSNKEMLTKKTGSEPILYNNMKGELYDVDMQKLKPNPSLTKKGSSESLNKTIVNKIKNNEDAGKIFHPVRSHSLHANKMFNGLTLTDVSDENGVIHKLVTKKSSSSLNETSNKNQNYSTLSKIPGRLNPSVYGDKINRSNTINMPGYSIKNIINPERNNTINSKMYLKSNTNNSDNKKIYEQLYKRNNTLTADIEAAKKVMNNEFEINDKDIFKIIDDSEIELTENPLLSSNPVLIMCPNLIDAISTSIPIDAYDFSDDEDEPPTPLCLETDDDFDPTEGLHSEPRGRVFLI